MFYQFHRQMIKMLGQLEKWIDLAENHAKSRSFDANVFVGYRLAPDQFSFGLQVQNTCDTAKLAMARLTGREVPQHPDTEKTLDELRARIRSVIAILDGVSEADYEQAAARAITTPRWEGKVMTGSDYFMEHALPNFFFHITHAYAILRHSGVNVGKRDYLGAQTRRDP